MRHGVHPAPCSSSTAPSVRTARCGEAPTWEGSSAGSAAMRPLPIKEEVLHGAVWDCCWAGLGCTLQAGDGSSPPSCRVSALPCSARAVLFQDPRDEVLQLVLLKGQTASCAHTRLRQPMQPSPGADHQLVAAARLAPCSHYALLLIKSTPGATVPSLSENTAKP